VTKPGPAAPNPAHISSTARRAPASLPLLQPSTPARTTKTQPLALDKLTPYQPGAEAAHCVIQFRLRPAERMAACPVRNLARSRNDLPVIHNEDRNGPLPAELLHYSTVTSARSPSPRLQRSALDLPQLVAVPGRIERPRSLGTWMQRRTSLLERSTAAPDDRAAVRLPAGWVR
jgi:hypothetical protein